MRGEGSSTRERGAALAFALLAILVLLPLLALAVDGGRALLVRERMGAGVDAAARGALRAMWLVEGASVTATGEALVPEDEPASAFAARAARGGVTFPAARAEALLLAGESGLEPEPLLVTNALGEEVLLPVDPDAPTFTALLLDENATDDPQGDVWLHRHPLTPVLPLVGDPCADAVLVRGRRRIGVSFLGALRRVLPGGGTDAVRALDVAAASVAVGIPASELGTDASGEPAVASLAITLSGLHAVTTAAGLPVTLTMAPEPAPTALVVVPPPRARIADTLTPGGALPPSNTVLACAVVESAAVPRVVAFARLAVTRSEPGRLRVRALPSAVGVSVAARERVPPALGAGGRAAPFGITLAPASEVPPEERP